ncbi:hypothetical protein [Phytoactinopolyspora halotolerans]|uniref:Uncharacterized protein n=1 Tax=Phytoactinopolyspora halotolerans TaxID=1981512 RepID=A0A6L9S7B5_9ACTN|nr:hypothetical protein [Phytoactinopolyspora halotolerans]NEE00853.1 hypothetical protein [Phytoactinopolyspora halotolerans]
MAGRAGCAEHRRAAPGALLPNAVPRLCNQAFFTRIYLEEDDDGELRVERSHPFDMLLDPGVQADAAAWAGGGTLAAHEAQTRQMLDQAKV